MNPEGGGCSEPRSCHCTPVWVTTVKLCLKKKKQGFTMLPKLVLNSFSSLFPTISHAVCLPWPPKVLGLQVSAMVPSLIKKNFFLLLFIHLFIFETEFHCCYPDWSAMARSRLTATSASWVQAILLPQPPEQLGLQAHTTMPS